MRRSHAAHCAPRAARARRPKPRRASQPPHRVPRAVKPLPPPVLDGDSSDEDDKPKPFTGSGFRLDGKAPKQPKTGAASGGGSMLGGATGSAPTRLGVCIGSSGTIGSAPQAAAAAPAQNAWQRGGPQGPVAPSDSSSGDDYWAKMSGGNKLR